jgi:hypothetical protein
MGLAGVKLMYETAPFTQKGCYAKDHHGSVNFYENSNAHAAEGGGKDKGKKKDDSDNDEDKQIASVFDQLKEPTMDDLDKLIAKDCRGGGFA